MAEKNKLEDVLSKIEKTFGKGSIQSLGEQAKEKYDVVSTGSLGLDLALGIGGLPFGRIVEAYGPESSGKSTLTLHLIAEGQKIGKRAAIIDFEMSFDPHYAESLGVNLKELYLVQPDNAEQGLEIADMLINSGEFQIVIVDSVAAMVPKAELDGEMGDSRMGVHARLMSQALRKMTASVKKNNVILFFINQLRLKIGVVFGNPETTPGGESLKFYASIRLDIRKGQQVKDGDEVLANKTKVKVVKNKCAPPFKVAEFQIEFGHGIDKMQEVLSFAVEHNIVEKAGSWYSYAGSRLGQGEANVKQLLLDNPELAEEIEAKVFALFEAGGLEIEKEVSE